jgi:hypothetical protein
MGTLSRTTRTCGIALAIVAGVVLSQGQAVAGCGDYVHIVKENQTSAFASPHHVTLLQDIQGGPIGSSKPCDSPNCSGNSSPPAIPLGLPAAGPTNLKNSVIAAVGRAIQANGAWWGIPTETNEPTSQRTSPIFHPPRF